MASRTFSVGAVAIAACAALSLSACSTNTASGGGAASNGGGGSGATIGVAMPISGPDAPLADPIVKGIKLAVKEATAKGDLPGPLSLSVEDDQEKPEIGSSLARKFCGDNSVIAAIGDYASTVALAAQPVYARCGLAQLVPTASNDKLSAGGYKSFFRNTAKNSDALVSAVNWITTKHPEVKTVLTIDLNTASTLDPVAQFVEQAKKKNLTVLGQVHAAAGQTDFRGALTGIIAQKPDLIYLSTFFNEGALMTKQLRELNYTGRIFGLDGNDSPDFVKIAGTSAAEGFELASLGVDPSKTPDAAPFVAAYQKEYGSAPNSAAAQAYDTARVVINAWHSTNGGTDRAKIIAAIAATQMTGTGGPIKYDSNGNLENPAVGIFGVQNGALTFLGKG